MVLLVQFLRHPVDLRIQRTFKRHTQLAQQVSKELVRLDRLAERHIENVLLSGISAHGRGFPYARIGQYTDHKVKLACGVTGLENGNKIRALVNVTSRLPVYERLDFLRHFIGYLFPLPVFNE